MVVGNDYDFDGLIERLAASGCTVYVVVLTSPSIYLFFNATLKNSKMSSTDVTFIGADGWTGLAFANFPPGLLGLGTYLSETSQTDKYNLLWASLGKKCTHCYFTVSQNLL